MKKILGIGNSLTDILLQTKDDSILAQMNLPKGSMQLVDEKKQSEISSLLQHINHTMVAGGSASNTVNGITRLGGKAGFIGKVGRDEVGEFYTADCLKNGVQTHIIQSDTPSGRCLVLISPNGERTMCTFLGASSELEPKNLSEELFQDYDIFHIEGYLVQNHDLVRKSVHLAKEKGLTVSIDLASYNVVEENLDFLKDIIHNYVDIVFANEEEARAFTGKEPKEALAELAAHVPIAIVKVGKDGSHIKSGDETIHVAGRPSECIDTTGAGDLYAAGFLYGQACGYPLEVCGKIASLVAGNAVEVIGPKMSDETWRLILEQVEEIIKDNSVKK
ncbi:adenosine kinase [Paludibacter sp. 221]|uniref:adenosine kinase n=1 Tax=Paludibacter sp. 221 TaxID=2302939 RepID=UPI0013D1369C|nr:adenosine kinase [Paludibacter sp. 221]NDV45792.1 adenosine kinase [Paludibacter sp. 221]